MSRSIPPAVEPRRFINETGEVMLDVRKARVAVRCVKEIRNFEVGKGPVIDSSPWMIII